jgi:hypothetical protein
MFMRVSEFGVAESVEFPVPTLGGRLFAELNAVRAELDTQAARQSSGKSSAEQGTTSKSEGRENLREDLDAIGRTARAMAEDVPGVNDKFRRPPGNCSDQALLATARAMAADAVEFKERFIEYGLPMDFLEDLNADIAAFEAAINAQQSGRRGHVTATAAIDEIIERGMKIVRRLDAIVRNRFRDDPARLAAWLSARHVERAPRRRQATTPAKP